MIDFTSARTTLGADEQAALMLTYRDRERVPDVARAVGCSIRKISYLVPTARRKLADELSRLGLLSPTRP